MKFPDLEPAAQALLCVPAQTDDLTASDHVAEGLSWPSDISVDFRLDVVRRLGGVVILDVDVQGALKLRREYPDSIGIFVLPPSVSALKKRLRKRGTETSEQLRVRFETARHEMTRFKKYGFEYVVVNQELDRAVKEVLAIIAAHGCRIDYMDKELLKRITG